jgi:hypothetical protein
MFAGPDNHQRGFTVAEAMVGLAGATILLIMGLTLLDYGRRIGNRQSVILEAEELSRAAVGYITGVVRESETGVTSSNPTNCLSCHVDTDGALSDNPLTLCPEDMTIPEPPIRIATFDVDPNNPGTRTPAEPGNGIWLDVDRAAAPAAMPPSTVFDAERRSLFPVTDPGGDHLLFQEEEDHDRDGTADVTGSIIYGLESVRFELVRATPPVWAIGTSVTPTCSTNPGGCHGTGNLNLGGDDIYGTGVWNGPGTLGEVWTLSHPDSQAVRGVAIELTAASRGREAGGQISDFKRKLRVVAMPRRLQQ